MPSTISNSKFMSGDLISNIIDFLIIAFMVFLAYKQLSRFKIIAIKQGLNRNNSVKMLNRLHLLLLLPDQGVYKHRRLQKKSQIRLNKYIPFCNIPWLLFRYMDFLCAFKFLICNSILSSSFSEYM